VFHEMLAYVHMDFGSVYEEGRFNTGAVVEKANMMQSAPTTACLPSTSRIPH